MFNRTKSDFLLALINNFLVEKSILIIDDEIEVQRLMANYLIKTKVKENKIVFASNGLMALEKIKDNQIGLIIVDIVMPEMNGLDLIEVLHQTPEYRTIPLVISSGNLNNEFVKQALLNGVKEILVKPFNYELFVERLCKALSH